MVKEEYGYERKQTLSNCERYISPILKEKESMILNAEESKLPEIKEQIEKIVHKIEPDVEIEYI